MTSRIAGTSRKVELWGLFCEDCKWLKDRCKCLYGYGKRGSRKPGTEVVDKLIQKATNNPNN